MCNPHRYLAIAAVIGLSLRERLRTVSPYLPYLPYLSYLSYLLSWRMQSGSKLSPASVTRIH
jgi:hypothetical protein